MNPFQLLVAALVCAALPAQHLVWFPSDHDPAITPDGSTSTNWFPYSYGVSRIMVVYERWDLGIPAGHAIRRIGFRADGTRLSYGKSLFLEVRMGQTVNTAANAPSSFDSNYNVSGPTTVFGPAAFAMPDMNNVLNPNPDGNMIWLTLSAPYTPDPNSNLVVEWRIQANSNGGASFNYFLDVGDSVSPRTTAIQVCPHTGGQTAQLQSRATEVGGNWISDLTHAPGNQPVVLFVSVGGTLQPPVPLNLFLPGTQPSCTVDFAFNSLFTLTATASNNGSYTFSVPIPNRRVPFNDMFLTSQAICADFFSPGGFVVSNGAQVQIGIAPAMTLLYAQGNPSAATGSVWRNLGLVTVFDEH